MEDRNLEEYKKRKKEAKQRFTAQQNLPYEVKVKRAALRVREFITEMDKRYCNAHVSVGGLDSITLLLFIRKLGYDIPAISVSGVEDKSIQTVHKQLGVTRLRSYKSKVEVLNTIGFPVISKRIAGKIDLLQHPTENNKTVRNAIITGECGAQGHFGEVRAFLIKYYGDATGQDIKNPLDTVTSRDRFGLVTIEGVDYQIVDIGLRMLEPRELYGCQGFPDDYIIDHDFEGHTYPRSEQVRRCGNSVCPPLPAAMVRSNLPELCVAKRMPNITRDRIETGAAGQLAFA